MERHHSESRNTMPGARPSKIVRSVADDFSLDNVEAYRLQVWTDRLIASIAAFKVRQSRRREGWQSLDKVFAGRSK